MTNSKILNCFSEWVLVQPSPHQQSEASDLLPIMQLKLIGHDGGKEEMFNTTIPLKNTANPSKPPDGYLRSCSHLRLGRVHSGWLDLRTLILREKLVYRNNKKEELRHVKYTYGTYTLQDFYSMSWVGLGAYTPTSLYVFRVIHARRA